MSVTSNARNHAIVLVLAGIVSVQFGGALAAVLVPIIGAPATVTMRLLFSAVVMIAVCRPAIRGRTVAAWRSVALFGIALGAMNTSFYESLARLPIGVAVTIEFLGPLGLSAVLSRRLGDAVAVLLAVAGVVLISGALTVPWSQLDHVGIGFAFLAGLFWAMYILCSREVGRHWQQLDGLAMSLVVAAVLVTPLGFATLDWSRLTTPILLGGTGIAILSSVLPYSLELLALRHLEPGVFGILLSLEPATAALAGLIVLHQVLSPLQLLGMALVVAASFVVMRRAAPGDGAVEPAADVG